MVLYSSVDVMSLLPGLDVIPVLKINHPCYYTKQISKFTEMCDRKQAPRLPKIWLIDT